MPARAKDMVLERGLSATTSKFCGRRRAPLSRNPFGRRAAWEALKRTESIGG